MTPSLLIQSSFYQGKTFDKYLIESALSYLGKVRVSSKNYF